MRAAAILAGLIVLLSLLGAGFDRRRMLLGGRDASPVVPAGQSCTIPAVLPCEIGGS